MHFPPCSNFTISLIGNWWILSWVIMLIFSCSSHLMWVHQYLLLLITFKTDYWPKAAGTWARGPNVWIQNWGEMKGAGSSYKLISIQSVSGQLVHANRNLHIVSIFVFSNNCPTPASQPSFVSIQLNIIFIMSNLEEAVVSTYRSLDLYPFI